MLALYKGHVYDPYCGSGGLFVQIGKNALAHRGRIGHVSVYDPESNPTTVRLGKMNLAIRSNFGPGHAESSCRDPHKGLKVNYALASSPFNMSDWVYGRVTGAAA